MNVIKKCEKCGTSFKVDSSKAGKFCSKTCYWSAKATLPKSFKCGQCGKEFENSKGKAVRRFCSRACAYAAPKAKELSRRQCPHCQVDFAPRWETQIFCSRECGYKNRRKERPTGCAHCGGALDPKSPPHVRFCSKRCVRLANPDSKRVKHPLGMISNTGDGYLQIKVEKSYPGASRFGWMLHHRYVMQEHVRKTRPDFVLGKSDHVHHKDGDRKNNAIENLEMTLVRGKGELKHVPGQRHEDIIAFLCRQHLPEVLKYLVANHRHELEAALAAAPAPETAHDIRP